VVVSTDSPTNPTRYTEARVLQEISAFNVELQLSPPNVGTIKPPVIIAEIFYQYTPMIPFTSRLINIPLLYETAIY
jgi:hypothetical protein